MNAKDKLEQIIYLFQWEGYRFNEIDDIVDFMKDYIKEAEDNKEIIEFTSEELRCDDYEMDSKVRVMNSDFDTIYEIARKYYDKDKDEISKETADDFNKIMDIAYKYL